MMNDARGYEEKCLCDGVCTVTNAFFRAFCVEFYANAENVLSEVGWMAVRFAVGISHQPNRVCVLMVHERRILSIRRADAYNDEIL